MGDFVPGSKINAKEPLGNQTKLIINFFYLLVGMGCIAMYVRRASVERVELPVTEWMTVPGRCYNLMKEEVMLRLRELKADLLDRLQDMGVGKGNNRHITHWIREDPKTPSLPPTRLEEEFLMDPLRGLVSLKTLARLGKHPSELPE